MSKYYCLIAGLQDVNMDDQKLPVSIATFKEEAYDQLSESDKKLFDLFFYKFDNINLLRYLKNRDAQFDIRATLTAEEMEEIVKELRESENPKGISALPYFNAFIPAYLADKPFSEGVLWEDQLSGLYYDSALQSSNRFVSQWFEFNLNINNILIALTARKYHFDATASIVGNNLVANAIRTTSSRDFGLTGEIDYFETLQRIADEPDTYERERKTDQLRWKWLEENTFFNYFTIEKVFAYLLKLDIAERWHAMNKEEGERKFREILQTLKSEIVIPDEFKVN